MVSTKLGPGHRACKKSELPSRESTEQRTRGSHSAPPTANEEVHRDGRRSSRNRNQRGHKMQLGTPWSNATILAWQSQVN